ncbi:MAG: hypothetical protein ACYDFT_03645 [Thermoplasmata archaeon]
MVLVSLAVSLTGFLVIAWVLYEFKFHDVTDSLDGVSTRIIFALGILLAASPFVVTIVRRVPIQFLAPLLFLLFFLYPLFSPYGLPYDRDPVFVFQFAHTMLASGSWIPGTGVTEQAVTYSYYPGGSVFIDEASSLLSTPLAASFMWSTELFRFLIIPPIIYALTARLFGAKAAPLAVLLYVVQPSIEMNIPTQQDFAVTFFLLTISVLAFLVVDYGPGTFFLRLSLIMSTLLVVVSHHVSTYILVGFLAAIALLPRILWRRDPYPSARSMPVFLRTLAFGVVWGLLVALPVILQQEGTLIQNVSALFHHNPATSSVPGSSFPLFEIAGIGLAVAAGGIIAILTVLEARRRHDHSFVTVTIIAAMLLAMASLPFLSTGFSFLALREFEYIGVILAPIVAWWIVTRLAAGRASTTTGFYLGEPVPPRMPQPSLRFHRASRATGHPGFAVILAALFILTGVLVPLSTRDQFAPVQQVQIDSPMFITPTAYSAVEWASAHLSHSHEFWGDYLAYTVFGGFGDFRMMWNSYLLFNGTGFSPQAISLLDVGSYIIIDSYMTKYYSSPMFWGPGSEQPSSILTYSELEKFHNTAYFSLVYVNPVFTIYIDNAVPPIS